MGRLKPSSAPRWGECAGSVALSENAPESFGASAQLGIAAAKLAERVLRKERPTTESFMGEEIVPGVFVDRELALNVQMYVSHVQERIDLGQLEDVFYVEHPLPIRYIHSEECDGVVDSWAYDVAQATVHVWELKYGHGLVEAEENNQFICYGAGIFEHLYYRNIMPEYFVFGIVQPRGFHRDGLFRFWRISAAELKERVAALVTAGAAALALGASTKSGSHCKNCPGILSCEASEQACSTALEITASSEPEELSNQALGRQLVLLQDAGSAIKNRLAALETQALESIKKGVPVPGYSASLGRGSRSWKSDQHAHIVRMGNLLGLKLAPETLLSPSQAEGLGMAKELVKSLVTKTGGKQKLTRGNGTMDLARKALTDVDK